jgi:hypothetical protein
MGWVDFEAVVWKGVRKGRRGWRRNEESETLSKLPGWAAGTVFTVHTTEISLPPSSILALFALMVFNLLMAGPQGLTDAGK